jgi:hypothetical protein
MIKRYNEFLNEKLSSKGDEIPDNFIELKSADLYLNVDTGKIYNSNEEDWIEGFGLDFWSYIHNFDLSEEDQKMVDKYYRSCESLVKSNINYDFIETAYDLSTYYGVLDNQFQLRIQVKLDGSNRLLEYIGSNSGEKFEYDNYFGNDLKEIEKYLQEKEEEVFNYYLSFIGDGNKDVISRKDIAIIIEKLKEMYPNLNINTSGASEQKFF